MDTDYLALKFRGKCGIDTASTRRVVLINIECLPLGTFGGEGS